MATLLSLPGTAVASSSPPNTVVNGQIFLGDVFQGTVDVVVEAADDATVVATALGNVASATSDHAGVDIENDQVLDGDGRARAELHGGMIGESKTIATAMGNGVTAAACCGAVDAASSQTVASGAKIDAKVDVSPNNDAYAQFGYVDAHAASTANAVDVKSASGDVSASSLQTNGAGVRGRADVSADRLEYETMVSGTGIGNAVTARAADGAIDLDVDQSNTGGRVAGISTVTAPYADAVMATGSAVANSIYSVNAYGDANIDAVQSNTADVVGRARIVIDRLGYDVMAGATATGNTALATTIGGDVAVDIEQENFGGGVSAQATIDNPGGVREPGRMMSASATAYGNVIGATACSECRQDIRASGSQINGADVSARTSISTGSAGSVGASATAVGNAATYQTVNPNR